MALGVGKVHLAREVEREETHPGKGDYAGSASVHFDLDFTHDSNARSGNS
jgi:hypothetical protein